MNKGWGGGGHCTFNKNNLSFNLMKSYLSVLSRIMMVTIYWSERTKENLFSFRGSNICLETRSTVITIKLWKNSNLRAFLSFYNYSAYIFQNHYNDPPSPSTLKKLSFVPKVGVFFTQKFVKRCG